MGEGDNEPAGWVFVMHGRPRIELAAESIALFCQQNHVGKFSLFGSVLRDDFSDASDIDVLVEFQPGFVPGLRFFAMEAELSELIGRKVDLNTPAFLGKYIREDILREAQVAYASP